LARLRLDWDDLTKFDKPDPENPSTGVQKEARKKGSKKEELLPLPLFIYISTTDKRAERTTKYVERTVLKDERVALGCHFFRCIRLGSEKLKADHPLAKLVKGRSLPRIVLVPRDKSRPRVLEGRRIKASTLYGNMRRVSNKFCKTRLDKYVSGMRDILNELDKLDQKKKKHAADKKRGRADARDKQEIDQLEEMIEKAEAQLTKKKFKVDPERDKPSSGDG